MGNVLNADMPLTGLVAENITVKKFVYDDDLPPEPVPAPVKATRSKSKKAKSWTHCYTFFLPVMISVRCYYLPGNFSSCVLVWFIPQYEIMLLRVDYRYIYKSFDLCTITAHLVPSVADGRCGLVYRQNEDFSKVNVGWPRCSPDNLFCNILGNNCARYVRRQPQHERVHDCLRGWIPS